MIVKTASMVKCVKVCKYVNFTLNGTSIFYSPAFLKTAILLAYLYVVLKLLISKFLIVTYGFFFGFFQKALACLNAQYFKSVSMVDTAKHFPFSVVTVLMTVM